MSENILRKLESSRKELLDFSLRNPLINYKLSKARGVQIIKENPSVIFDLLVRQGKSMSFSHTTSNGKRELEFDIEEDKIEGNNKLTDSKLQTNETELALQKRLLGTFYTANTIIEEQGVNTLYLSIGMLQWFESESSMEQRFAPILLVPVTLERTSAREKFKLKYSQEDIGMNISIQAKLKSDFNISVPDLPEIDDLNIDTYLKEVERAIKNEVRWLLDQNSIELGFFSFGKFLIYNDLDSDKWPDGKKPATNALIQGIFEGEKEQTSSGLPEDVFIDRDTNADQLFQVVDADSSQIQAILAIQAGRNQIIQGPPGTGKSQTITNIISNAIGEGKKVLFVAEKMAALEVVKRRLDNNNLGEACLELHSNKANKKDLLNELKRVLELGKPTLKHLEDEVVLLTKHRNQLNDYSFSINSTVGKSNLSTHQVLGKLLQVNDYLGQERLPKIPIEEIKFWTANEARLAEDLSEQIQAKLNEIGEPTQLLFWGVNLKVIVPRVIENIQSIIDNFRIALTSLNEVSRLISAEMGLNMPQSIAESIYLNKHTEIVSQKPLLNGVAINDSVWISAGKKIEEIIGAGKQIKALRDKYENLFMPEIWAQDWIQVRMHYFNHGHKWYKFLIGDYTKSKKMLLAYCKNSLPKESSEIVNILDGLIEVKRLKVQMGEWDNFARSLFGEQWQEEASDWNQLADIFKFLFEVHTKIEQGELSKELLNFLSKLALTSTSFSRNEALKKELNNTELVLKELWNKLAFDEFLRFSDGGIKKINFNELFNLLEQWMERISEINNVVSWNILVSYAKEENLELITNACIGWENANKFLKASIQKTWYDCLYEEAIQLHPSLANFDRTRHEEISNQFRLADLSNFQLNKAKVSLRHFENLPNQSAGGQMGVLRTEFNKKSRHFPIRKLVKEAGLAIQSIKPVFMMSPMSIANFIPPGTLEFDLVIFDEASQVRPVEAMGAILRGKQLVVVGDSKQLPPTSFFDSLTNEVEDEENITSDIESILGLCDAQGVGVPQKMLRWHYRSRHESLIRFSNHQFYDNRLVVFPSPNATNNLGMILHHLPETEYERGTTRTNPKEAQKVVEAIVNYMRNYPHLSIGVVSFSSAQRQVIEDEFELQRKSNPAIETYIQQHITEPFFIKNLENVQGDERDIILISIGYGRTKEGFVSMSFGPLNSAGGEKRLNVLITRAKQRCEVFTNLTSDEIDVSKSQSLGLIALKNFLYYAKHGKISLTEETGKPADSYFEEHVAQKLREYGYEISHQVGSNGFFIDLAVIDPKTPGRYLLGIECDGRMYHSARSARDRDRLRQQVLEGMGWKIHRIWSTDWFKNQDRELKRVIEAIEKAKLLGGIIEKPSTKETIKINKIETVKREEPREINNSLPKYEMASLPVTIGNQEIHTYPTHILSSWIEQVVKVESPVHFEEVARRILEAGGVSKLGSRIRESLWMAALSSNANKTLIMKGEFLYSPEQSEIIIRDRKGFAAISKKIKYISEEEAFVALTKIVNDAFSISIEDSVSMFANTFGFGRLTADISAEIMEFVNEAIRKKLILKDKDILKLP
jgi:very-short-patch-repair endonuclease/DNA polymerase III delta prime subunit